MPTDGPEREKWDCCMKQFYDSYDYEVESTALNSWSTPYRAEPSKEGLGS